MHLLGSVEILSNTAKAISLALAVFISGAAFAQGLPPDPLPPRPAPDENGVDLAGWHYSYQFTPISIGDPAQGGMSLTYFMPEVRNSYSADLSVIDPHYQTTRKVIATFGERTAVFNNGPDSPNTDGVAEPGASLEFTGSKYTYKTRDGVLIDYNLPSEYYNYTSSSMFLCGNSATFPNGEVLTFHVNYIYSPDTSENLWFCRTQSVVSNRGYQIKFEYASNNTAWPPGIGWKDVVKVTLVNGAYEYCNPNATSCAFSLSWPTLIPPYSTGTYSNNLGQIWQFRSRAVSAGITARDIKTPGSSEYNLSYHTDLYNPNTGDPNGTGAHRVASVVKDGKVWNYAYNWGSSHTTVTAQNPDGGVSSYYVRRAHDDGVNSEWPPLVEWSKNQLNYTRNYEYYSDFSLVKKSIEPEGNFVEAVYDGRGNATNITSRAKSGSVLGDIVTSAVYPATCTTPKTCNKPTSVTDPRQAKTDYTYDASHGGVLTEMAPAPSPGTARPLKINSYTQKYAYVLNSVGTLVAAAAPVWVRSSEMVCQTVVGSDVPTCDIGAPQQLTAFEYGADGTANNLLIHGKAVSASGTTLRTCYGYDRFGNQISETNPRAGLAACP